MSDDLHQLIADLEQREIVCSLPIPSNTTFNLVNATKKRAFPIEHGPAVTLHNPLILGGWGASSTKVASFYAEKNRRNWHSTSSSIFWENVPCCAAKMKVVQALKNRNSDSEKSLFRKTMDEEKETWSEMPLVTLEGRSFDGISSTR